MNGLLAGSLSLLWLSAGQLPAEPATPPAGPVVTLGKPVVTLGKPKALDAASTKPSSGPVVVDHEVQPVLYSPILSSSDNALTGRQQIGEPLPLPRSPIIDNSTILNTDPGADLGPMPRAGTSTNPPLPAAPLPAITGTPNYGGAPSSPPPGSVVVGPYGPGYPVAPGTAVGQPVIHDGVVNYGSPGSAACGEAACDACEKSKHTLLPFFEGGCTDYGNPPSRYWVSLEYLLWQVKNPQIPALVTTSPPNTVQAAAGVLPAAATLFPPDNGSLFEGLRSGARLTFGMWLTQDQSLGIESSSFFLGQRSNDFGAASSGTPIIARPFVNVSPGFLGVGGGQASQLVAYPGILAGSIGVHNSSELYGTELNLRSNLWRNCCWRLDAIGGFRYMNLNESLDINENLVAATTNSSPGGPIMVRDSFETNNNFYGGQVGLDMGFKRGRWSLDLLAKIALGDMHESVRIDGATAFPGLGTASPGGLFAQPSNIGTYDRNRLAFIPEGGLKVGFQATQHCKVFVGYSYMYLSDVVRPGDQIDTRVDLRQVAAASFLAGGGAVPSMLMPPATFPGVVMKRSDFWAQGVNFGVEFRF